MNAVWGFAAMFQEARRACFGDMLSRERRAGARNYRHDNVTDGLCQKTNGC
ncbi:hypothetical protein ACPA9J_26430 [Pseudomonas aeruginosa]